MEPTGNGDNGGRDEHGRFTTGNPGGPGNPHAQKVARLRSALLAAVTEDDIREVIEALVKKAKGGDIVAARILFDRVLGPPIAQDILQRLDALEAIQHEQH